MENMQDFVIENGVLKKYKGPGGDVTIPEGVKGIGWNAFNGCPNLTSVTIPEGVTIIAANAFYWCTNLTSVTIPEGVKEIGRGAFEDCASLQSVIIPEGITKIGRGAFEDCASLQSVIIPESVKKIGRDVFRGCCPVLIAPHISIYSFAAANRPGACAGFAKAYLDGREIDEEIKAGYLKYIEGQRKRLYPLAIQHEELLQVMLAEKMLGRKDIDPLLEESDKQNNISAKAAVLDYAGRNLKPVDPLKEFNSERTVKQKSVGCAPLGHQAGFAEGRNLILSHSNIFQEEFYHGKQAGFCYHEGRSDEIQRPRRGCDHPGGCQGNRVECLQWLPEPDQRHHPGGCHGNLAGCLQGLRETDQRDHPGECHGNRGQGLHGLSEAGEPAGNGHHPWYFV